MNALILLLSMCWANPIHNDILDEEVHSIEINHFYDDKAKLIFTQFIFWDSYDDTLFVRDWRLVKKESRFPQVNYRNNRYELTWIDGEYFRKVYTNHVYHTWTQRDVEYVNRDVLPKEDR